jgi:hypothetical protein
MIGHPVVRIDNVSAFADVETVGATVVDIDGVLQWRLAHDVALRRGDAMEQFPESGRLGDVCTLRIIRGYAGSA